MFFFKIIRIFVLHFFLLFTLIAGDFFTLDHLVVEFDGTVLRKDREHYIFGTQENAPRISVSQINADTPGMCTLTLIITGQEQLFKSDMTDHWDDISIQAPYTLKKSLQKYITDLTASKLPVQRKCMLLKKLKIAIDGQKKTGSLVFKFIGIDTLLFDMLNHVDQEAHHTTIFLTYTFAGLDPHKSGSKQQIHQWEHGLEEKSLDAGLHEKGMVFCDQNGSIRTVLNCKWNPMPNEAEQWVKDNQMTDLLSKISYKTYEFNGEPYGFCLSVDGEYPQEAMHCLKGITPELTHYTYYDGARFFLTTCSTVLGTKSSDVTKSEITWGNDMCAIYLTPTSVPLPLEGIYAQSGEMLPGYYEILGQYQRTGAYTFHMKSLNSFEEDEIVLSAAKPILQAVNINDLFQPNSPEVAVTDLSLFLSSKVIRACYEQRPLLVYDGANKIVEEEIPVYRSDYTSCFLLKLMQMLTSDISIQIDNLTFDTIDISELYFLSSKENVNFTYRQLTLTKETEDFLSTIKGKTVYTLTVNSINRPEFLTTFLKNNRVSKILIPGEALWLFRDPTPEKQELLICMAQSTFLTEIHHPEYCHARDVNPYFLFPHFKSHLNNQQSAEQRKFMEDSHSLLRKFRGVKTVKIITQSEDPSYVPDSISALFTNNIRTLKYIELSIWYFYYYYDQFLRILKSAENLESLQVMGKFLLNYPPSLVEAAQIVSENCKKLKTIHITMPWTDNHFDIAHNCGADGNRPKSFFKAIGAAMYWKGWPGEWFHQIIEALTLLPAETSKTLYTPGHPLTDKQRAYYTTMLPGAVFVDPEQPTT